MASYTPTTSAHETLVANTADTVTFAAQHSRFEVANHDASAVIYVRADGTAAAVAADGAFVVLPGQLRQIGATPTLGATAGAATQAVSLISSGTPAYSVTAL